MSTTPPADGKHTLVEAGTKLTGGVVSACPVVVNGTVEGNLEVPQLTVSATGTVTGSVAAQVVFSEGIVGGKLKARRVQLSGVILPDTEVDAEQIDIHVRSEGKAIQLTFGESPAPKTSNPSNGSSRPSGTKSLPSPPGPNA